MTAEAKERLERLATPRPDSQLSVQASGTRSPSPAADGSDGHNFSPKIDSLWHMDWQSVLCTHSEASTYEAIGWFLASSPAAATIKSKTQLRTMALRALSSCQHSEADTICKHCHRKLCDDCWQVACSTRKDEFDCMAMDNKIQALQETLDVNEWQARALIRNSIPAQKRLYTLKAKAVPRKSTPLISPSSTGSTRHRMESGDTFHREVEANKVRQAAWDRLTKPREPKVFADIPYLPLMSNTAVPHVEALEAAETADDVQEVVDKLKDQKKITDWQGAALLRCAVPVFERLYTAGKASAGRGRYTS